LNSRVAAAFVLTLIAIFTLAHGASATGACAPTADVSCVDGHIDADADGNERVTGSGSAEGESPTAHSHMSSQQQAGLDLDALPSTGGQRPVAAIDRPHPAQALGRPARTTSRDDVVAQR
jgi:hypothetical protein